MKKRTLVIALTALVVALVAVSAAWAATRPHATGSASRSATPGAAAGWCRGLAKQSYGLEGDADAAQPAPGGHEGLAAGVRRQPDLRSRAGCPCEAACRAHQRHADADEEVRDQRQAPGPQHDDGRLKRSATAA